MAAKKYKLISIPVSPWSERAKFALEVAGCLDTVEIVDYTPLVDEVYLRYTLGKWDPRIAVSVPVLVAPDGSTIEDSVNIAKWAATQSKNGRLVIPDDSILSRVRDLTEQAMYAGRYRSTLRCGNHGAFDLQDVPSPMNKLPNWFIAFNVSIVNKYLTKKYSKPNWTPGAAKEEIRTALLGLRQILQESQSKGGKYFYGNEFSLADIIVTGALAFVAPVQGHSRLGPKMMVEWQEADLAEEFKDLVAWRDAVYSEKRTPFQQPKL